MDNENVKGFNHPEPRDHLVLPDRQAYPGCDNSVDHAVGNYIVKHRPAVIIDIGDHADMPSLSMYDVGKKSFEGRRYRSDIEASVHAHEIQFKPLFDLQDQQRRNGKKMYDPLRVLTIGNHEQRILKAIENDPKLDGVLSMDDLKFDRFFHHAFPFLEPVMIDGVCYVHYAFKKMPHMSISGEMQARTILKQQMVSTTVGHSPEFHYFETFTGNDKKIQCVVAGCRFTHRENYAGARNERYTRCIIHKRGVKDGQYDIEKISIERLLREYL